MEKNKDLIRYKTNQTYVTFDTETEGLNLIYSRPWQLSYVVHKGKELIEEKDILIHWEGLKLSDYVKKLTGFSQKRYEDEARDPKEVWEEFKPVLHDKNNILVGQNLLGFDIYMVDVWNRLIGEELDHSYLNRILDTRALAIAWRKEMTTNVPKNKGELLAWQFRMINGQRNNRKIKVSQNQLLKDFGIPFEEEKLHNALYDCQKCFEVFQKLIWEVEV